MAKVAFTKLGLKKNEEVKVVNIGENDIEDAPTNVQNAEIEPSLF